MKIRNIPEMRFMAEIGGLIHHSELSININLGQIYIPRFDKKLRLNVVKALCRRGYMNRLCGHGLMLTDKGAAVFVTE